MRRILSTIGPAVTVLLVCVIGSASAASSQQGPADLILHNAKILTLTDGSPEAQALPVRGETLIAVGREDHVMGLRGERTRVVDAGGRRVIPGLNDSHIHAVRGGRFYNLELRWDGVKTLEQALGMVRDQAKRTPKGQWVRVIGGWSSYRFKERRMPTVAELNLGAPDTPVFVLFLYSQALMNQAGVEDPQLTPQSVPPAGGRYDFADGGGALARQLGLPLRISNYLFAQKAGTELQDYQKWTAEEQLNLNRAVARLNGFVVEGAGENLVWSAGDFENFLAPRPELNETMEGELTAVVSVLAKHQWPIRIHATYDESIGRVLEVLEPIFRETGYTARWCIDHAETISERSLARIKAMGGGIAVQDRLAFAGEIFAERYGKDVAAHAPPLRAMVRAGIPLGAGTDATRVSSHTPWLSLYWMVTGKTVGGTQLSSAENRLSRDEALRLYTVGSAWFSGEEELKGTIAPGRYADFAILSADYLSVPEEQIPTLESVLTVTGGDIVYASDPFAKVAPAPLPPVSPTWSPVAAFGGYQQSSKGRDQ